MGGRTDLIVSCGSETVAMCVCQGLVFGGCRPHDGETFIVRNSGDEITNERSRCPVPFGADQWRCVGQSDCGGGPPPSLIANSPDSTF